MKNSECTIYIETRHSVQTIHREKNGWKQTSSRGIARDMTAEQVLSHMLPVLTGKTKAKLRVVRNAEE